MSRSDWSRLTKAGLVSAAVLLFALAGLGAFEAAQLQRLYQDQAAKESDIYEASSRERWRYECLPLAGPNQAHCTRQIDAANRENEREERDLEAQRTTAIWTSYMGAAALVGMAASLVGVGLVFFTFRETREAAEAARKTHQAFVDVERAVLIPSIGNGRALPDNSQIVFGLTVGNVGRSSAKVQNVQYAIIEKPLPIEHYDGFKQLDTLVKEGTSEDFTKTIRVPYDIASRPYIGGFIEYRSAFGILHKSYFCARVTEDPNHGNSLRPRLFSIRPTKRDKNWPQDT